MRLTIALALMLSSAPAALLAAQPPLELAQKSLAQARSKQKRVVLNLRVTQTGDRLEEWTLKGIFEFDGELRTKTRKLGPKSSLPLRLLWIATLASDPVAALGPTYGLVNAKLSTVGVQDDFVYVYGTTPGVSFYRDLKRLAAFSVKADGHKWVTRLSWNDQALTGVMITRDGRTVLTARSLAPVPGKRPN